MFGPVLLLLLAVAPPATAESLPIAAVEKKLAIWSDGKAHYVVAVPFPTTDEKQYMFYGDGKTFWQQRVESRLVNGRESFFLDFWEPRVKAFFGFRDGKASIHCEERTTEITRLGAEETTAMLASARFLKPRWPHEAYALSRDKAGTYYYVDRQREPQSNRNFRVFVGRRGSMKQLKLTDVVSDSAGEIFVTKNGRLRVSIEKNESSWVQGKTENKLVLLPVEDNAILIHEDLGVYVGEPLGTPCDDL
jgi:hypothetical protein